MMSGRKGPIIEELPSDDESDKPTTAKTEDKSDSQPIIDAEGYSSSEEDEGGDVTKKDDDAKDDLPQFREPTKPKMKDIIDGPMKKKASEIPEDELTQVRSQGVISVSDLILSYFNIILHVILLPAWLPKLMVGLRNLFLFLPRYNACCIHLDHNFCLFRCIYIVFKASLCAHTSPCIFCLSDLDHRRIAQGGRKCCIQQWKLRIGQSAIPTQTQTSY
jgi:hypothetical protein